MNKNARKKLEQELFLNAEKTLVNYSRPATTKIKKALKVSSRLVAKKFSKAIKSLEKKKKQSPKVVKSKTVRVRSKAPARKKK